MAADFGLSGRAAIVTGGNGRIGLDTARALARTGRAVSIWGRNPAKNHAALAEFARCGAAVEVRTCDVTDRAAVEDAFARTPRSLWPGRRLLCRRGRRDDRPARVRVEHARYGVTANAILPG